jgi:hypothetical protein
MRSTPALLVFFLLSLSAAWAQSGSWTNQAGHVLSAVPVELKGSQVVFQKGSASVTYPLSVFLPAEQTRLKAALGIVEVPPGLVEAHALAQRVLKRLETFHTEGRLSDEAYQKDCAKVRQTFREKGAPFVAKGLLSEQDVTKLIQ